MKNPTFNNPNPFWHYQSKAKGVNSRVQAAFKHALFQDETFKARQEQENVAREYQGNCNWIKQMTSQDIAETTDTIKYWLSLAKVKMVNGWHQVTKSDNLELFSSLDNLGFFDFHTTNGGSSAYVHQISLYLHNGYIDYLNGIQLFRGVTDVHHIDSDRGNNSHSNLRYTPAFLNSSMAAIEERIKRGAFVAGSYKMCKTMVDKINATGFGLKKALGIVTDTISATLTKFAKNSFDVFNNTIEVVQRNHFTIRAESEIITLNKQWKEAGGNAETLDIPEDSIYFPLWTDAEHKYYTKGVILDGYHLGEGADWLWDDSDFR
jgi:hypothetical protein